MQLLHIAMNRIKNEIEHFTKLEHIWWGAKTFSGQKRYDKRFVLFKKLCSPKKNKNILEIGCGDGEFTKRLIKLSSKIIATDITPEVIRRAKKKYPKSKTISFKVDDAENFSFKDNSFDIVCGISILHHVNYKKALKECFRVLKPGGKLFFSEPNYFNPIIYLAIHTPWLREKMEYSPDEVALKRLEIDRILKKTGFDNTKVYNYDFLHPSTPKNISSFINSLSPILESIPGIREMSGSIILYAEKT